MKHKRFLAFACAFLLAAQLVPAAAFAQKTTTDDLVTYTVIGLVAALALFTAAYSLRKRRLATLSAETAKLK